MYFRIDFIPGTSGFLQGYHSLSGLIVQPPYAHFVPVCASSPATPDIMGMSLIAVIKFECITTNITSFVRYMLVTLSI